MSPQAETMTAGVTAEAIRGRLSACMGRCVPQGGAGVGSRRGYPSDSWLVPVGATISKTLSIAKVPVSLSLGYYANVVHPDGGSPWLTRMVVTFMFPK